MPTVSLHAIEDVDASDALQYAGLGAGGHRTGEAKRFFREAVRILIKFASLRNTCVLLHAEIKSTLRLAEAKFQYHAKNYCIRDLE